MLENFQLAAIVKTGGQTRLLRIPLHQSLQETLAENWQSQHDEFTDDIEEIDFDPGYKPDENERFRLEGYELPDWLRDEDSQSVADLEPITGQADLTDSIKGVVGFARNDDGEEIILFQNFSRSHVIKPGRFLLLRGDTYQTANRPGLNLADKLSAVYFRAESKLLFFSFRTTNSFFPLMQFYREASEQDIREVLSHDILIPEDADAMAVGANQWFRKRFAMLRDSGILDRYTAQQITDHSVGYDVNIRLEDGKIVFPSDKAEAKRLLQFLNEEIFIGAITETVYETNSKREAD